VLKDHTGWIAIVAVGAIVIALLAWLVISTSGDKVAQAAAPASSRALPSRGGSEVG